MKLLSVISVIASVLAIIPMLWLWLKVGNAADALKTSGCSRPWLVLWSLVKSKALPHRTLLWVDSDGFVYDPKIRQYQLGPWLVWRDKWEMRHQRAIAENQGTRNNWRFLFKKEHF